MKITDNDFEEFTGKAKRRERADVDKILDALGSIAKALTESAKRETPAPEVNVTVPAPKITVPAPEVNVNMPEQKARPASAYRFNIVRDSSGLITTITATPI